MLGRLIPATREGVPYDKVPGERLEPLLVDGVRVGPLICWESAYPGDARQLTRDGAQVLLIMTNNASFGTGAGPRQHLAAGQLRAVESGRTIVQAAVTGISAVIGPAGQTSFETGLYQDTVIRVPARPAPPSPRTSAGGGGSRRPWSGSRSAGSCWPGCCGAAAPPPPTRRWPSGSWPPAERAMRALVVIPTYNEAESVVEVLDRVLAADPRVDVLVVDDGSPDGTAKLVLDRGDGEPRVHLMERSGKQGLGAAYRAGFGWGLERGYDALVEMDADLSHPRTGCRPCWTGWPPPTWSSGRGTCPGGGRSTGAGSGRRSRAAATPMSGSPSACPSTTARPGTGPTGGRCWRPSGWTRSAPTATASRSRWSTRPGRRGSW